MRHIALSFLVLFFAGAIHAGEFTVGPVEETAIKLLPTLTGTAHSRKPLNTTAPADLVKPRFGSIEVNRMKYGLVLYKSEKSAIYYNRARIDFNRDGKLQDETPIEIPKAGKPFPVTVKFKGKETPYTVTLRGLDLLFRPRDWSTGTILYKNKPTRAALVDGTFDNRYDDKNDGLLIDLNQNGMFEANEAIQLAVFGKALVIENALYEIKTAEGAPQIVAYSGKTGKLTITCSALTKLTEYKKPILDFRIAPSRFPRSRLQLRKSMPLTIDLPVGSYFIPNATLANSPSGNNSDFVLAYLSVTGAAIKDGETTTIDLAKPKMTVSTNTGAHTISVGIETHAAQGVTYSRIWPSEKNDSGRYLAPAVSVSRAGEDKPFTTGRMQYG